MTRAAPGARLGPYALEELLGRGAMGEVYLARDSALERPVAVKVMRDGRGGAQVERFVREARALARIQHPNVVTIYGAGASDGVGYMALELVAGGSLAELAGALRPFPPGLACRLLRDAARGLAAAHACGILHRDIKPDNLLVTPDGSLKLADFGLAKGAEAEPLTRPGAYLGTPAYSSPEQVTGGEVGPATDVYALGVVLYELLAGELPHDESDGPAALFARIAEQDATPLAERRPDLPARLSALVDACLTRDPARRPTAENLATALAGFAQEGAAAPALPLDRRPGSAIGALVRSTAPEEEPAAPGRPRRLALALGFAILLLGAGGALAAALLPAAEGEHQLARTRPLRVELGSWSRTGEPAPELAWLEQAAPDLVGSRLTDAGFALGVGEPDLIVAGAIYEDGEKVAVVARALDPSGRAVAVTAVSFARDDVLSELDRLGLELGRALADYEPPQAVAAGPDGASRRSPEMAQAAGGSQADGHAPTSPDQAVEDGALVGEDVGGRRREEMDSQPVEPRQGSGPAQGGGDNARWPESALPDETGLQENATNGAPVEDKRLDGVGPPATPSAAEASPIDALAALGSGSTAWEAARLLYAAADSEDPDVRQAARAALERLPPEVARVIGRSLRERLGG